MAKRITEDGEIVDVVTHEVVGILPPFFKTPWNHDTNVESDAVALSTTDASKTQQQHAKDADINVILAKFLKTGELNLTGNPQYQHFDQEFDLMNEMVTAHQVQEAWDALPIAARNILKDPQKFADYVEHCLETGDLDPLRELGLAKPKEKAPEAPIPPPPTPGGSRRLGGDSGRFSGRKRALNGPARHIGTPCYQYAC